MNDNLEDSIMLGSETLPSVVKYDSVFERELVDIEDNVTFSSIESPEGAGDLGKPQGDNELIGTIQNTKRIRPWDPPANTASRPNPALLSNRVRDSYPDMFLKAINSADISVLVEMIETKFAPDCQLRVYANEVYTLDGQYFMLKYWYGAMTLTPDAIFTRRRERKFPLPRKDKVSFAFNATVTKIYAPNVFLTLIGSLVAEMARSPVHPSSSTSSSSSSSSSSSFIGNDAALPLSSPKRLEAIAQSIEDLRGTLPAIETPVLLSFTGTMSLHVDEDLKITLLELDSQPSPAAPAPGAN